MIVWGGDNNTSFSLNTGGRYGPTPAGHVSADAYGDTDNHAQAADTYTAAASHVSPSATAPVASLYENETHCSIRLV